VRRERERDGRGFREDTVVQTHGLDTWLRFRERLKRFSLGFRDLVHDVRGRKDDLQNDKGFS
jgi:hypothetical protein